MNDLIWIKDLFGKISGSSSG